MTQEKFIEEVNVLLHRLKRLSHDINRDRKTVRDIADHMTKEIKELMKACEETLKLIRLNDER